MTLLAADIMKKELRLCALEEQNGKAYVYNGKLS